MTSWPTGRRDADLERELRSDLDLEEQEQRDNGSSPEEARYAARLALGKSSGAPGHAYRAYRLLARRMNP